MVQENNLSATPTPAAPSENIASAPNEFRHAALGFSFTLPNGDTTASFGDEVDGYTVLVHGATGATIGKNFPSEFLKPEISPIAQM